jgi:hypothetical protein
MSFEAEAIGSRPRFGNVGSPPDHSSLLRGIQFPTRGASLRIIHNVVRDIVHGATDLIRQTAKNSLRPFSGAMKQLALLMMGEEKQLSTIDPAARPDVPSPHAMPEYFSTVWQRSSAQVPAERIPANVLKSAQILHRMTYDDGTYGERYEYANLIIELADGRTIQPISFPGTSYHEESVSYSLTTHLPSFNEAQICGRQRPERFSGPVRVWLFHTHPQSLNQPEATKLHGDGRYYTLLSQADCKSADRVANTIVEQLRQRGFTGPIEVVEAAIPVPLRPLENLGNNTYIATYTHSTEA